MSTHPRGRAGGQVVALGNYQCVCALYSKTTSSMSLGSWVKMSSLNPIAYYDSGEEMKSGFSWNTAYHT